MPFNRLYYPEGSLSSADKAAIAKGITDVYAEKYPTHGTLIVFHSVPEDSFFNDGKVTKGLVRITLQFLEGSWNAREFIGVQQKFTDAWKPYVMDRGLEYELQIEIASLNNISFNGFNPLIGDEFFANRYYETMVKENRMIPNTGLEAA